MAEVSYPFENADTTESQFQAWASALAGEPGVVSGLGVSAGSGMQVAVAAGTSMVFGFYYENTTSKTLAIGAAPAAGSTRLDYVVLRLDRAANAVTAVVKAGTANSSGGSLPALTRSGDVWEFPLAVVTVGGGVATIVGGNIQSVAPQFGLRVLPYASDDLRPTPVLSTVALGVNTTTRRMEAWVGGTWYNLTPDVTWAGVIGKPTTFPPADHSHTWDSVTGKPAVFTPATHVHDDRYYTETEIDQKLSNLPVNGHLHDDRYYTESEMDVKINTLNTKVDSKASGAHTHTLSSITNYPGHTSSSGGEIEGKIVSRGSDGRFGILDGTGSSHPVNKSQLDAVDNVATNAWEGDLAAAVYSRTLTSNWRELFINSNGLLGWVASSRRFKQNIEDAPIDAATALQLRPVTFRYRKNAQSDDPALQAQVETGLIAEEVDALGLRFLVDYDSEGRPDGIVYSRLGLALIPVVKDLQRQLDQLRAEVATLKNDGGAE